MRLIYGEPLGFKGTLLATMVLFTTVLASGDALAGACKDTTREGVGSANFDTTVRNQTSNMTFDVVIERYTASTGKTKEIQRKTIAPGEIASRLQKTDVKDKYTLTATITTSGSTTGSATCAYKINYTSSGHLRWDIAPDMETPCKDEALLCSSCAIACKKSFNTNKDRYNTKFTITN